MKSTAWLGLAALLLVPAAAGRAADKPNILLIYADDIGYGDVGCYGATAVKTPNVDRLAKEGLRFTSGYCAASTCTPSRYTLITGEYAFRKKGTGILPGDAAMIVPTDRATLPSLLQRAGYATGIVGKWHLGLGQGGDLIEWNGEIKPGPREAGFGYSFIMAATGDRAPCVYIENQRIVGLDPSDPVQVSYGKPFPGEPTGISERDRLKVDWAYGHNDAVVNGIGRIGFMKGGQSARWKDEDMADTFTGKGVAFIERNKDKPFFLYFATHDIHVPRVPHPRFVGKTAMGPRGDAIVQFDACVGELLATLDRLKLTGSTLVILTSDNGPVLNDGYKDGAAEKLGGHKPAGPLRGGKGTLWEGGTRVPLVVRWPARVKPGVSDALMSQVDFCASFAALAGQALAPGDAPDSLNMLPALLGESTQGRDFVLEHSGKVAIRQGPWKFIPAAAGGGKAYSGKREQPGVDALYDLAKDPAETASVAGSPANADRVARLRAELGERMKPLPAAGLAPEGRAAPAAAAVPGGGLSREVAGALSNVTITGSFWAPRLETNRTVTLPHALKRCEETGRLSNFDRAAGVSTNAHKGSKANDSDVYKILEGAAYTLQARPDPQLEAHVDGLIARIAAAQEKDGYLSTYFTCREPDQKWANLHKSHELYCAGHLFEAAVACQEATGKRALLDTAVRLADHIDSVFGPEKRHAAPGHEEIELALVKLYRATGEPRYLGLCRFFLDQRGTPERLKSDYEGKPLQGPEFGPKRNRPPEYQQDHMPVVDQREAVGHAVRAGYLYAGMADVAACTGSADYGPALKAIWQDVVSRKLYLTGSMGTSQHQDEGLGDPYLLPNESAYCETCAAVANLLWNHRMSLLYADARYADLLELVLYNGFLSGVSLGGDRFFYRNPLSSKGAGQRRPWLEPACCPSNLVRLFPQLARYLYAVGDGALYVNQFVGSSGTVTVDGQRVRLEQRTGYPWDGNIELRVEPERELPLALYVRIPGWARGAPVPGDLYRAAAAAQGAPAATLTVNGKPQSLADLEKGYACIRRIWKKGDVIALDLPMPAQRVYAHAKLEADRGRVALMRGPLVYCLEGADHTADVQQVALPADAALTAERRSDLLGGVTVIRAQGLSKEGAAVGVTAIPYYAWNNRGAAPMAVWMLEERARQ